MQDKNKIIWVIVGVAVLALAGYAIYGARKAPGENRVTGFITNFEECAAAGFPVQESYPRQCTTPEGSTYVEEINTEEESTATAGEGCYIGGCSGQICSDEPGVASDCEYRPEYACYKNERCEKQANGRCGWTESSTLMRCLELATSEISK